MSAFLSFNCMTELASCSIAFQKEVSVSLMHLFSLLIHRVIGKNPAAKGDQGISLIGQQSFHSDFQPVVFVRVDPENLHAFTGFESGLIDRIAMGIHFRSPLVINAFKSAYFRFNTADAFLTALRYEQAPESGLLLQSVLLWARMLQYLQTCLPAFQQVCDPLFPRVLPVRLLLSVLAGFQVR